MKFERSAGARWRPRLLLLLALAIVGLAGAVLVVGLALARPFQTVIGPPAAELGAQAVEIPSSSGSMLHGWLAEGRSGGGVVVLMHGVRANRLAMERRAIVLKQQGFSVLLFDFQAHGESLGRHITFGHLEGLDAQAAVAYVRRKWPNEHIGSVSAPLLVASGTADAYTTIDEARDLFAHAPDPKQFWAVSGAAHVDLEAYDSAGYWSHVMPFLIAHLQGG